MTSFIGKHPDEMTTSEKLRDWMNYFYNWSADEDNSQSELTEEFNRLREIIKEIEQLEEDLKNE